MIVMRRTHLCPWAISGGWLHQTRPVGKSTCSFLPTRPSARSLRLLEVGHRVRWPQRDTQFTLGPLSIYCLMILSMLGLCCCGGVSGYVSGAVPSLWCLGFCSTGISGGVRAPGCASLCRCGSWIQLLPGVWGLQDHGLNPCLLHWLADSSPPGKPHIGALYKTIYS